jgi:hypothetical protein
LTRKEVSGIVVVSVDEDADEMVVVEMELGGCDGRDDGDDDGDQDEDEDERMKGGLRAGRRNEGIGDGRAGDGIERG